MLWLAIRYRPLSCLAIIGAMAFMGYAYTQMLDSMARMIVVTPCECHPKRGETA